MSKSGVKVRMVIIIHLYGTKYQVVIPIILSPSTWLRTGLSKDGPTISRVHQIIEHLITLPADSVHMKEAVARNIREFRGITDSIAHCPERLSVVGR
jgi:hypothetical protein